MRTTAKYIGYVFGLSAVVLIGLELLLRLVFPDPDYYWRYRFLFISPNAYQNLPSGIWIYQPHTAIREVGVYGMPSLLPPGPFIEIEYDCRAWSNNLGLLQDDDIQPGTSVTLIVGDSFVSGHGGCPWFGRLQARRPNERLANGGAMGTGFSHWQRLIEHLRGRGVNIQRILAIAISDDFMRRAWVWNERALNCMNHDGCPINTFWQSVALDARPEDLLKRGAARFQARFPNMTASDFVALYIQQNSHAYKFVAKAIDVVRGLSGPAQAATQFHAETDPALSMMKSQGIPFHVIMVPQRAETGPLGMARMTHDAIKLLDSHGIAHSWCSLSARDFLPNDGHPNRAGYDKLAACADAILSRMN